MNRLTEKRLREAEAVLGEPGGPWPLLLQIEPGNRLTSRNWAQVLRTTNMATLAQWQTAAGFAEGARLTAIERILAHAQGREIDPKRPLLGQLDITLPGGAA
jgi:hypothetical protein